MSKNPLRWAIYLVVMAPITLAISPIAYAIDGRDGLRDTWHTFWMYAPTSAD